MEIEGLYLEQGRLREAKETHVVERHIFARDRSPNDGEGEPGWDKAISKESEEVDWADGAKQRASPEGPTA